MVGYSPWGLKESDMTEWLHFLLCVVSFCLPCAYFLNKFLCSYCVHVYVCRRERDFRREWLSVWALWHTAFSKHVGCIHTYPPPPHTLPWRGWVYVPHNPLNLGRSLWQFWPTDNGANDILWLSRLGCQENATPGPWEPSLGAVRKLKLAHLEGPRRRTEFPQSTYSIKDQTCEWMSL